MNKTIGFSTVITGLFFLACGLLHACGQGPASLPFDVDTVLFIGAGALLLVAGGLLWGGVPLTPPGSLMTRRDDHPKH